MTTARREIVIRGETPVPLVAEPGGAEIALPEKDFQPAQAASGEPDPEGRIMRDREGLIQAETTVVPFSIEPGAPARVHVVFRPSAEKKAHWNNEVENLGVWINPPPGWAVDRRHLAVANPPQPVSQEVREVEFEVKSPTQTASPVTIPAYALYYTCEDVDGTCLYRRQDLNIHINVEGK